MPILKGHTARDEDADSDEEFPVDFPPVPAHQDDPLPPLNLALRTCGHVDQWQHVPGMSTQPPSL